ncbi:PD-(D/E)XK nuclease family protein [Bradyrhizobium australafricanum]|uniref:PD-(D/E)XK nuclease family protein n=1 Tax=Bradyrhizobium australafricanum TaxID=2821406 RepID=UPI00201CAB9F|nr:PD-(D/E)XK nuclease family protein [Bradyrhizobium australafricanum]
MKVLLRDPIRFIWRYALGWKVPEDADEPLILDPNAFGTFVHAMLRDAVEVLERDGGIASADPQRIEAALANARDRAVAKWEDAQPMPPDVIWRSTTARGHALATAALAYGLAPLPNQKSWCEIPFGKAALNPMAASCPGRWTCLSRFREPAR